MKRNKIPVVKCGDTAWGGQGRTVGRVIMSDGTRKEGQALYWGRGAGPRAMGGEESCLSCTYCIGVFCLSLSLSMTN